MEALSNFAGFFNSRGDVMKPTCLTCNGEGQVFDGVVMHPNPASYSDYEEIWEKCEHCGGTGKTWKDIFVHTRWIIRETLTRLRYRYFVPTEEDEIPF